MLTAYHHKLIEDNTDLALRLASSFVGGFVAPDSEQGASALFGLVEAARNFDPAKGEFAACLYLYVRKYVYSDQQNRMPLGAPMGEDHMEIPAPEKGAEDAQTVALRDALATLPDKQAGVLRMRYLEGMKLREVAERVRCSIPYVHVLEKKALAALRCRLSQ